MHLAAQEDRVPVAEVLAKYGSEIDSQTKVCLNNVYLCLTCIGEGIWYPYLFSIQYIDIYLAL